MFIQGGQFIDDRGKLFFNNSLDLSQVKRMYVIENSDIDVIRAWQGHAIEKRWFIAIEGLFEVKIVKIDNFENPSDNLIFQRYMLDSKTLDCLEVEPGYASSIQAQSENAKMVVFSDYRLGEVKDEYKFDSKKWK